MPHGNCYILHHKVIVVDARTVITGSYNFISSAERDNDENLVIVDDPRLARVPGEVSARFRTGASAGALPLDDSQQVNKPQSISFPSVVVDDSLGIRSDMEV